MPIDDCTPKNAVAKLAGIFDAGGIETTERALSHLDDNAKMLFHQVKSQSGSQALDAAAPKASKKAEDILDEITESEDKPNLIQWVKGGVMDTLKPDDYLPPDVKEPVFEYLNNFFAKNYNNLKDARLEYKQGIRAVTEEITPALENLDEATKGQAAHWLRDLREGYPFYGKSGTIYDQGRGGVVANVLDFSGTVLLGNPIELLVKAPAVYGIRPTFKGIGMMAKETKFNPWAKIGELEAAGVYGIDPPKSKVPLLGPALDAYAWVADNVMAVTDRPLKNLAYFTGKAKGGSVSAGQEAVERIAFKNRFGNDARLVRSNRDAVTLMNYTFNTYHMLGGMGKGLLTPGKRLESARQLGMWYALTAGIGGQAAVIPAPLSALLRINDDYAEWEDANLTTAGKLVRPGGVTFGVGAELLNRVGAAWERGVKKGAEKWSKGDTSGAMLDFGDAGITLSTALARNPLGNTRIQRMLRNTRDLFEGDIDFEEYTQEAKEIALPALKQAK
jgi:hypothetical protein